MLKPVQPTPEMIFEELFESGNGLVEEAIELRAEAEIASPSNRIPGRDLTLGWATYNDETGWGAVSFHLYKRDSDHIRQRGQSLLSVTGFQEHPFQLEPDPYSIGVYVGREKYPHYFMSQQPRSRLIVVKLGHDNPVADQLGNGPIGISNINPDTPTDDLPEIDRKRLKVVTKGIRGGISTTSAALGLH